MFKEHVSHVHKNLQLMLGHQVTRPRAIFVRYIFWPDHDDRTSKTICYIGDASCPFGKMSVPSEVERSTGDYQGAQITISLQSGLSSFGVLELAQARQTNNPNHVFLLNVRFRHI